MLGVQPPPRRRPAPPSRRLALALLLPLPALACSADPIQIDGQYGRPLPLGSGDGSPLPRLAFIDEGCPGALAAGGCEATGDRECQMLLVDSLAPMTTLREPGATGSRLSVECLEVRPAAGLFASEPAAADLQAAVARFRFDDLPLVRATEGGDDWSWTAGNQQRVVEPAGVLGGNLLRNLAVAIRTPVPETAGDPPAVTLYGEFPGSEAILADQGRAFLPVQFPGRLLGRDLSDRCDVDEGRCELDGFDISTSSAEPALVATRMVMDACIAIPPCGLVYVPSDADPFAPGSCVLARSNTLDIENEGDEGIECVAPGDPELGGLPASLVVATGVPGLVLFSDSAARMFGDVAELTPCPTPLSPQTEFAGSLRACLSGYDGELHFSGWPSAGEDEPLPRLRIRSLALVPGGAQSRNDGPCERADERRDAMLGQCNRYAVAGDIRDASPPYSAQRDDSDERTQDPAASAVAVIGEPMLEDGATGPRPSRWITATVLPADHPLALAVRRDVAPDALEPDGLLGTALFPGTETVLDYTDPNPALRVRCLRPHDGRCQVLPSCHTDQTAACCHGLPRTMLDELIRTLGDDTCCGALSAEDLAGINEAGHCLGVAAP